MRNRWRNELFGDDGVVLSPDGVGDGSGTATPSPGGTSAESPTPAAGTSEPGLVEDNVDSESPFDFPDDFEDTGASVPVERDKVAPEAAAETVVETKPTQTPQPAATPEVSLPAAKSETTPAQPTATPAATTTEQPQGQPSAQGAEEVAAPRTLAEQLEEIEDVYLKELEAGPFKLSQEDVETLDAGEVSKVLPRLGSRVYYEAVKASLNLVEKALPGMVTTAIRAQAESNKGIERFYGKFPELRPHHRQVFALAQTVRALNPEMGTDEFIQKVGEGARALLGVAAPAANGNGGAAQVQVTPAAAAIAAGVGGNRPVTTRVPSAARPQRPADPNDWGNISDLFDMDAP